MTLTTHEEEKLRRALALVVATTPMGRDFEKLEEVRIKPMAAPRGRRPSRSGVAVVAFAAAVVLMAPITLLLTGDGNGATTTPPAGTDQTVPEVAESGLPVVSLGDPLWQRTGDDVSLGKIVSTGSGFLVNGTENTHAYPWPVFTLTSPDGITWTQAWEEPGFDMLGPVASDGTATLAVGASGGDASTLYRWNPNTPSWDPIALPLPEGAVRAVAQNVTAIDQGWMVAGIVTPSDFDDRVDVVVWRSTDTIEWTTEILAEDLGGVFYPGAVIASGDNETVLGFAQIGELEGEDLSHPVIFDTDSQGGWNVTDLMRLVVDDGRVNPAMVNLQLIDAETIEGVLTAWWLLNDGQGDLHRAQVIVTRRIAGSWSATDAPGPFPRHVTPFGGELLAIRQSAIFSPGEAPTVLLRSTDGTAWEEFGSIDGVAVTHLLVLDNGRLLVGGSIPDPRGSQATTGGIWILEPSAGS